MEPDPDEALDIFPGGLKDFYTAVGVFYPGNGEFLDGVAQLVGNEQKLGVEEPFLVLHQREQFLRGAPADCFEAALRIGDVGAL